MLQQFYIRAQYQRTQMDNQDEDIPVGLGQPTPTNEPIKMVCYPEEEREEPIRQTNKTNIIDAMNRTTPQPQFNDNFRRKSIKVQSREKDRYRTKAVSENYDLRSKDKEERQLQEIVGKLPPPQRKEQVVVEEESKPVKKSKKHRQPIKLPPTTKTRYNIATEPSEHSRSNHSHHFNRKDYLNEKILHDVDKFPIKYKIMCEVFGCKPHAAFQMHKEEAQHIQEQYTKQKGLEYLRQGNAKAKYRYIRDQRVNNSNQKNVRIRMKTQNSAKIIKDKASVSAPHAKVKSSKSQKLLKLTNKEAVAGQKVYDRVKKHIAHNEQYSHNYFKHLTSEESIDHALVNFLKTKIKRAQIVIK